MSRVKDRQSVSDEPKQKELKGFVRCVGASENVTQLKKNKFKNYTITLKNNCIMSHVYETIIRKS